MDPNVKSLDSPFKLIDYAPNVWMQYYERAEQCLERTACTLTHTYHRQSSAWNGPVVPGHTIIRHGHVWNGHVHVDTHLSRTEQCLERTGCTWTHNYKTGQCLDQTECT